MSQTNTPDLPPRPTEEQIARWPSCRIIAVMHDFAAAIHASDSPMAKIQLRQAYNSAGRAMLAQVQAESFDGRRFDLPDEAAEAD